MPAGTELYHGRRSPEPVEGMEWFTFEPEHAIPFANRILPPEAPKSAHTHGPQQMKQRPLNIQAPGHGYLHTYRTKHPLRVLYIDGESAAKSFKGTLDTMDRVLLHDSPPCTNLTTTSSLPNANSTLCDANRGRELCELAAKDWQGRIDGFVRLQPGFELIMCDIGKDLDYIRATVTLQPEMDSPLALITFDALRALVKQYDGIGGRRITLDYDDFVTAYTYDGVVVFQDGLPRVDNSSRQIERVRRDITQMVLRGYQRSIASDRDWRDIVELVVSRYSDRIELLSNTTNFNTLQAFIEEADYIMSPFIDYLDRQPRLEISRRARQFLPFETGILRKSTAYQAILHTTTAICRAFQNASNVTRIEDGVQLIRSLKDWLDWSSFRICRGCQTGEICFTAIWPWGMQDDIERPRCMDRKGFDEKNNTYWI